MDNNDEKETNHVDSNQTIEFLDEDAEFFDENFHFLKSSFVVSKEHRGSRRNTQQTFSRESESTRFVFNSVQFVFYTILYINKCKFL